MSVLSPIALSILNNIQANTKNDDKASDGAFLSLLETGGGFSATGDAEQSFIDSLDEPDDVQAIAAPVQVPTEVYVDNRRAAPAAKPADKPKEAANDDVSAPQETPAVANSRQPAATKKEAPAAARKTDASQQASKTETTEEAVAATNPTATSDTDAVSFADQINQKIQQLNALLSLLSSLPAGAAGVQVIGVQVTKITLTTTQQNLQVNQPFIDLSDRFKQLIAAVTASQNLPGAVQASFASALQAFKNMADLFAAQTPAAPLGIDALGAQLDACQMSIKETMQIVQVSATTANADTAALAKDLEQLNRWLNDVQAIVAPKQTVQGTTKIEAPSVITPVTDGQNTPGKNTGDNAAVPAVATGAAAATAAAPLQQSSAANNAAATNAVATAIENSAAPGGNLSSGGDKGGQGGERQQTGAVQSFSATNAARNSDNAQAASFSKALKATHAPVAEQVVFNIKTAVKDGASKIQIQLDPAELGKLHIKIDMNSDGKATGIIITADHKSTLDLLQRDARGLENALADAGIKAESGSLSFNLRGGDQGQQQDDKRSALPGYAALLPEEDELAPLSVITRNYTVNITDGLDIKI